jgi:serine/threonine protein kinase/Tol biopolymer transport system component
MGNINEETNEARWRRLESLYTRAVGLPPGEREDFLATECAGDESLLVEVVSLLKSGEREDSFLGEPAFELGLSVLAAEQSESLTGQTLGPYKLLKHLGRGGMGEVYLAEDPRLGRKVALKLLPVTITSDPGQAALFELEARSASSVSHPHVAHVYETGEARGRRYIAMEYVEGGTLRNELKGGAVPLGRALEIAAQVASALSAAHAAGVVHRDVKPENMMLRPDGYVKVLDFGLASQSSRRPSGGESSDPPHVRREPLMGTARYMSPEQARGEQVDGGTDLWSLGVVLFEMVTGRAPFEGDNTGDVITSILHTEPNLDTLPAGLPVELRRIIGGALKKDRASRYRTAEDMLADLNDLRRQLELSEALERSLTTTREGRATRGVTSKTVGTSPATHHALGAGAIRRRLLSSGLNLVNRLRHNTAGATVGLLMLFAGVASVTYWRQKYFGRGEQPGQLILTGPARGRLLKTLTAQGRVSALAVSPDGKYVAYAAGGGFGSLQIMQVADESEREIVPPSLGFYGGLTFSRGGDYIYYLHSVEGRRNSTLYRASLNGGLPQKLVQDLPAGRNSFALAPDERRMVYVKSMPGGATQLIIANIDGTGEQVIYYGSREQELISPAWSPDGRVIACVHRNPQSQDGVISVELSTMTAKQLAPGTWPLIYHIAWLEDGRGLVMSASHKGVPNPPQLWLLSYPGGKASNITNDLDSYPSFSLTTKADLIAAAQQENLSDIWVTSVESTDFSRKITAGERDGVGGVVWGEDGKILYVAELGGSYDIWSMDSGGNDKRRLTSDAGWNLWPTASPDGRFVVYSSNRTGQFTVWRMNADGTDQRQLVAYESVYPEVSHDGNWVTYIRPSASGYTLWRVSIEGGHAVELQVDQAVSRPALSPDGQEAAYFRADGQGIKLMAGPIGDTHQRTEFTSSKLPGWGKMWPRPGVFSFALFHVRWHPDGRSITYKHSWRGGATIWGQSLDGGSPRQLASFNCAELLSFDWSRDGKKIVAACGDHKSNIVLISDFR